MVLFKPIGGLMMMLSASPTYDSCLSANGCLSEGFVLAVFSSLIASRISQDFWGQHGLQRLLYSAGVSFVRMLWYHLLRLSHCIHFSTGKKHVGLSQWRFVWAIRIVEWAHGKKNAKVSLSAEKKLVSRTSTFKPLNVVDITQTLELLCYCN